MNHLAQLYNRHAKTVRYVGSMIGAALIVSSLIVAEHNPMLAGTLDVIGAALGGTVLVPHLTKRARAWLTGGGAALITAAIGVASQCLTAAAAQIAWCPSETWSGHFGLLLAALGTFAKFGAWVPAPDAARASKAPPAPDNPADRSPPPLPKS